MLANFLIAIVEDSFTFVMDNEDITSMIGRIALNEAATNETYPFRNSEPIYSVVVSSPVQSVSKNG
jgi:hypothetical protein